MQEFANNTKPFDPDSDKDEIYDGYEVEKSFLDPNKEADAYEDQDNDGYNNQDEYLFGSDPEDPESTPHSEDWSWLYAILGFMFLQN